MQFGVLFCLPPTPSLDTSLSNSRKLKVASVSVRSKVLFRCVFLFILLAGQYETDFRFSSNSSLLQLSLPFFDDNSFRLYLLFLTGCVVFMQTS